jgi:hypothetical protein
MSYPDRQGGGSDLSDSRHLDLYAPVFRVLYPLALEATATGPICETTFLALAYEQSGLDITAIAPDGGLGLFSMTIAQARSLAPELGGSHHPNLTNPVVAMHLARRYLEKLLRQYDDIALALMAFHFGPELSPDSAEAASFLRRVFSTMAWLTRAQPWERPVPDHATTTHAYQALAHRHGSKRGAR